jgi:hypothetical protein
VRLINHYTLHLFFFYQPSGSTIQITHTHTCPISTRCTVPAYQRTPDPPGESASSQLLLDRQDWAPEGPYRVWERSQSPLCTHPICTHGRLQTQRLHSDHLGNMRPIERRWGEMMSVVCSCGVSEDTGSDYNAVKEERGCRWEGREEWVIFRGITYPGPVVRDAEIRSLQYLGYRIAMWKLSAVMRVMTISPDTYQSL